MSGFHKAVCLAAMVALAVPSLSSRADDPPLRLDPLAGIPAAPPAPPAPPALIVGPEMREGMVIFNPVVRGQVVILNGGAVITVGTSDEDPKDLFPIVGHGFASDRPVDGSLFQLIRSLQADSYSERAAASETLMRLPPDRLPEIVSILSRQSDPEAISRLKTIAGHLFLKPRTNVKGEGGFLGIGGTGSYVSMLGMKFDNPARVHLPGGDDDAVGVRVMELQPGFPAAQDLRTGDCILAIADKAFPEEMVPVELLVDTDRIGESFMIENTNRDRQDLAKRMFQDRIRAVRPGSVANFTLLRDGKVLDILVQLAAMPANNRDSLSALVELRNQMMHDFVESLKTGEHPQSAALTK